MKPDKPERESNKGQWTMVSKGEAANAATKAAKKTKRASRSRKDVLGDVTAQALRLANGSPGVEGINVQTRNSKKKSQAKISVLDGELTIYTVQAAKQRIEDWIDDDAIGSADLSGITEIDTAGVQLLIAVEREKQKRGVDFHLVNCSRAVLDVVDLYRMREFLHAS